MVIFQIGVFALQKLQLKHTNSGIKRGTFAAYAARLRFHAASRGQRAVNREQLSII
jgi:hypothetical protein